MNLLDRIIALTKDKGISIRQLERACNMGNGVIDNWSKSYPRSDKLLAVANYLQTSVDYLLTGKYGKDLTPEEENLVEAYRLAAPAIQTATKKLLDIPEPEPKLEKSPTSRTG